MCLYLCLFVLLCVSSCSRCVCLCLSKCVFLWVFVWVCSRINVCVCICVFVYVCLNMYIFVRISVCVWGEIEAQDSAFFFNIAEMCTSPTLFSYCVKHMSNHFLHDFFRSHVSIGNPTYMYVRSGTLLCHLMKQHIGHIPGEAEET